MLKIVTKSCTKVTKSTELGSCGKLAWWSKVLASWAQESHMAAHGSTHRTGGDGVRGTYKRGQWVTESCVVLTRKKGTRTPNHADKKQCRTVKKMVPTRDGAIRT